VAAVVAITLATLPFTGVQANINYAGYLLNVSAAHAAGGGAAGATAWEGAFANMEGLLGLAAALVGQQHPLAVDVLTLLLAVGLVALLAVGMHRHWTGLRLPLRLSIAAVLTGLLLDPHLYAQDCVLLVIPAAMLLWHLRDELRRMPQSPPSMSLLVLLVCGFVMNFSAIDTLWSQGLFVAPLHLFTLVLLAAVVRLCVPTPLRRSTLPPAAAEHSPGGRG
jgi:hypothetical protein